MNKSEVCIIDSFTILHAFKCVSYDICRQHRSHWKITTVPHDVHRCPERCYQLKMNVFSERHLHKAHFTLSHSTQCPVMSLRIVSDCVSYCSIMWNGLNRQLLVIWKKASWSVILPCSSITRSLLCETQQRPDTTL